MSRQRLEGTMQKAPSVFNRYDEHTTQHHRPARRIMPCDASIPRLSIPVFSPELISG